MFVEIKPGWTETPMVMTAELHYFETQDAELAAHVDTLVFALDDLIGAPPSVSLRDPEPLRKSLYDRVQRIEAEIGRLRQLKFLLDNLPPGHRMSKAETLRMLEGILD